MEISKILLSPEDEELRWIHPCWWPDGGNYWMRRNLNGKCEYLRHVILARAGKIKPSPKHVADHEDRDRNNNRRDNLRWITYSENAFNRTLKENKLTYNKRRNHWELCGPYPYYIFHGSFASKEEALAYWETLKLKEQHNGN